MDDQMPSCDRAYRIAVALKDCYEQGSAWKWEDLMIRALTDLRHLCDVYDMDLGKLDMEAHRHYLDEKMIR